VKRTLLALAAAAALCLALPAGAGAVMIYTCGADNANLCSANEDGTGQKQITTDGVHQQGTDYNFPSLSADGKLLAFDRGQQGVTVMNMETGARTPFAPRNLVFGVEMRPDGQRVGVTEKQGASESAPTRACTYTVTGGDQDCRGVAPTRFDLNAEGRFVATAYNASINSYKICLYHPAGGPQDCERDLVSDPNHGLLDPAVSPDGKLLAVTWVEGNRTVRGQIAIYSLETGQLVRQLTNGPEDQFPEWTQDGSRVVFTRGNFQTGFGLYSIAATGTPGEEKLIVAGGVDATFGGPLTVAPYSKLSVSKSQKGAAVKGSIDIGNANSKFGAVLRADSGDLSSSKLVTVGTLKTKTVPAGPRSFTVKLTSKAKSALAKNGKLKVQLVVSVQAPGASKASTKTVKVTLKPS
jgi:hypothetical protein